MSESWPMVPLGEVLGSVNRSEPADDNLAKENQNVDIVEEIKTVLVKER